ncbi:MAG: hypothetical protein JWP01_1194 [Myxococcales bacterium]|nr:hypothetical protein [Myxococcales bacterium]
MISHLERGLVIAYNYGRMELIAKASAWAEGGNYQDMLVGMFRPVARGK